MTFIKTMQEHQDVVRSAKIDIARLARNLEAVGLTKVSDELFEIIAGIYVDELSVAYTDEMHQQIAGHKQNIGSLLSIAVNGGFK